MDTELMKYLTEEDKKRIAEKVYEEECRKIIIDDVNKRSSRIFSEIPLVYTRVLDKYIDEMDLYHQDFVEVFKKKVMDDADDIINGTGNNEDESYNTLSTVIGWKLREIGQQVIDESKEDLKPIIKKKVFDCCNETLLVAFLSDIVRQMNLDSAVKKLIQETQGDKK